MIGLFALAAETLAPVAGLPPSGSEFNPWLFWPLIAVGTLVVGLIVWHRKNPTAESKAQAEALDLAKETVSHLTSLLHGAHVTIGKLSEAQAAVPAVPTLTETPQASHSPSDGFPEATDADVSNASAYFWRAGEMLGYRGERLTEYVSGCNFLVSGTTAGPSVLTDVAKQLAADAAT